MYLLTFVYSFGQKTWREETTWETSA